ncbi:EF-P 5-aminopentanol modification-associated protein YfmH [Furfurilactobacillus siliginis]|uniref:Peptidase M16 n=1 Tax=Furfurilactobacillus siliginis TaxID=348151 RepID=A0A0R2L8M9_9LACO|nr:pitrilysin family protein [Furfurilactobacillus siliginis]KRN95466.1 Zn-dependent peptidase [Furfurilactobacillus siliginis]GEK28239.1 peptidase M16 [Furfurilactobacillus siliginis]
MEKYAYEQLGETLYRTVLPNGLQVQLLPKAGFHKTYALLTTDFGSIDRSFTPRGQTDAITIPDGVAHFLEHKMFEKADHDAFDLFGEYGADANAYTSFTRTSYLFSASRHLHENLDVLLDFVQDPYFTSATVNKEKGIIGQEIQMYDDEPGWQLFMGIIGNLYPTEPVHIDIAGTVDSIAKITAEQLLTTYQTFYHPSNMNLFVVGAFDPEQVMDWITSNQAGKTFSKPAPISRQPLPETDATEILPYRSRHLDIVLPKSIVGLRGLDEVPTGRAGLKYSLAATLLLDILFADTSDTYLKLYDTGVIDDSFDYDFTLERSFHFLTISSDTPDPNRFSEAIITELEQSAKTLATADETFELVRREAIGHHVMMLNSVEGIANAYDGQLFDGANLLDEVAVLQAMTLQDVRDVAEQLIQSAGISVFDILPVDDNDSDENS